MAQAVRKNRIVSSFRPVGLAGATDPPRDSCTLPLRAACDSTRIIVDHSRLQPASFGIKNSKPPQPPFLKSELKRCSQYAKPVFDAAPKIDRRSLRKIFRWAGDFANSEPEVGALRQHLVIKNKVIGIFDQRQFGQDLAAEGSIAC